MASDTLIPDIILIGPIGAGKSTVGELLADGIGVRQVSLDELCWDYYQEIGYTGEPDCHGSDDMIDCRFHIHAVERLLAEHRNCVIDFGAGHSVCRDHDLLTRLREALACYPNIFLLLPSPDLEESARVLRERNVRNRWLQTFIQQYGYDPNDHFLRHTSNFVLAKSVIYTNGKSPAETADEVLGQVVYRPFQSRARRARHDSEDIAGLLSRALEEASAGGIRSAALITVSLDGTTGSWARIATAADGARVTEHLDGLREDLEAPPSEPDDENPQEDDPSTFVSWPQD